MNIHLKKNFHFKKASWWNEIFMITNSVQSFPIFETNFELQNNDSCIFAKKNAQETKQRQGFFGINEPVTMNQLTTRLFLKRSIFWKSLSSLWNTSKICTLSWQRPTLYWNHFYFITNRCPWWGIKNLVQIASSYFLAHVHNSFWNF